MKWVFIEHPIPERFDVVAWVCGEYKITIKITPSGLTNKRLYYNEYPLTGELLLVDMEEIKKEAENHAESLAKLKYLENLK